MDKKSMMCSAMLMAAAVTAFAGGLTVAFTVRPVVDPPYPASFFQHHFNISVFFCGHIVATAIFT